MFQRNGNSSTDGRKDDVLSVWPFSVLFPSSSVNSTTTWLSDMLDANSQKVSRKLPSEKCNQFKNERGLLSILDDREERAEIRHLLTEIPQEWRKWTSTLLLHCLSPRSWSTCHLLIIEKERKKCFSSSQRWNAKNDGRGDFCQVHKVELTSLHERKERKWVLFWLNGWMARPSATEYVRRIRALSLSSSFLFHRCWARVRFSDNLLLIELLVRWREKEHHSFVSFQPVTLFR